MIQDIARQFIGWGWRHQARGPQHIDCVGLPILVARQLGIVPPDFDVTGYSRKSDLHKLVDIFRQHLPEKNPNEIEPDDLVVTRDFIFPCHCGIIGKQSYGLSLIHSRAALSRGKGLHAQGQVREEPFIPWRPKTTHAFSWPL